MSDMSCSLLSCDHATDDDFLSMADYGSALPRWCPGCGDHSLLSAVQRLLESEQLKREKTVFCSGIGCSSRFPHYMKTYGFHSIHGRALPVATGIKMTRPDLDVFAVMGDGDCCSIGAAHWVHAIRYNVNMVAMLLDNNIYGLTKNQTSPTTPQGHASNTQPLGSYLPALNPLAVTLGITNASFVAQTADWAPAHLYQTIRAAFKHKGFAFVRVLQRCPVFTPGVYQEAVRKPDVVELLIHKDGVRDKDVEGLYKHHIQHDPSNLAEARRLAEASGSIRLGLFYRNEQNARYDKLRELPKYTAQEKIDLLNAELDQYAV
ncbi:MAG: thiamine pyrophosphate-dependent enzyme [Planctomycetota bacterium]